MIAVLVGAVFLPSSATAHAAPKIAAACGGPEAAESSPIVTPSTWVSFNGREGQCYFRINGGYGARLTFQGLNDSSVRFGVDIYSVSSERTPTRSNQLCYDALWSGNLERIGIVPAAGANQWDCVLPRSGVFLVILKGSSASGRVRFQSRQGPRSLRSPTCGSVGSRAIPLNIWHPVNAAAACGHGVGQSWRVPLRSGDVIRVERRTTLPRGLKARVVVFPPSLDDTFYRVSDGGVGYSSPCDRDGECVATRSGAQQLFVTPETADFEVRVVLIRKGGRPVPRRVFPILYCADTGCLQRWGSAFD